MCKYRCVERAFLKDISDDASNEKRQHENMYYMRLRPHGTHCYCSTQHARHAKVFCSRDASNEVNKCAVTFASLFGVNAK